MTRSTNRPLLCSAASKRPSGEGLRWALSIPAGHEVIGTCGFHNWKKEHARAEIGYEMDPRYWGQGLMSEAVLAILGYGFAEMRLNRVEAFVTVGNRKSISFLERKGFTRINGFARN